MKKINMILASTLKGGIGKNNDLPWKRLKKDMNFFRNITKGKLNSEKQNGLIMGSNTFNSFKNRILDNRINVVLTSKKNHYEQNLTPQLKEQLGKSLIFAENLEMAQEILQHNEKVAEMFVIGGGQIYNQVLENDNYIDNLYWTRIFEEFDTDTFINLELFKKFQKKFDHKWVSKTFVEHQTVNYDIMCFSHQKTNLSE